MEATAGFVVPERREPRGPTRAPVTFTVCLPAYQVAPLIGDALASLQAQTRPPDEIVVCDDGSTDDLDAALEPYRHLVVLIRQANAGLAQARNAAVEAATGDFVVNLDPDDLFLPTRLARLAQLAAVRPDLDILTSDAWMEVDGRRIGRFYTPSNPFVTDDQRGGILGHNFVFVQAAVRRAALLEVGGYDPTLPAVEDWDCWIRLILAGASAGLVDEPLSVYRLRPGSISSDRIRLVQGRVAVLAKALARDDLTPAERGLAIASFGFAGRMLELAELEEALADGAGDARARAVRVAVGAEFDWRSRTKAAAAATLPGWSGSRIRARRERLRDEPGAVRAARE